MIVEVTNDVPCRLSKALQRYVGDFSAPTDPITIDQTQPSTEAIAVAQITKGPRISIAIERNLPVLQEAMGSTTEEVLMDILDDTKLLVDAK